LDQARTQLEGQFLALRVDLAGSRVELIPDALGVSPLFLARRGTACVFANSVAAIRHLTGAARRDDLGTSSQLTLGWVSGDKTLVEDVTALSGGRIYQWDAAAGVTEVPITTTATLARPEARHERSTAEVAELMRSTTRAVLALPTASAR
jgi:asparagine synthetase B (glutamine-hydrolysing)